MVLLTAYCPLGGNRADDNILTNDVILDIAKRNNKSAAQVLISWAVKRNTSVIPKSSNKDRIISNLEYFELSDADFKLLNQLGKKKRYVNPKVIWGVDVFDQDF